MSSGGSVQRKIPAVLRKRFLLWSPGRETRQAGQRAVGGGQGPSRVHVETSQAWQLGGCALHTATLLRAGTHLPCSLVGGQGCKEGPGHSPDFKAFPLGPRGTLHPVLSCHRGGGRCCFFGPGEWEASGRSSWEVPGGSGGVGSCCPARVGSQWPPRSLRPQA